MLPIQVLTRRQQLKLKEDMKIKGDGTEGKGGGRGGGRGRGRGRGAKKGKKDMDGEIDAVVDGGKVDEEMLSPAKGPAQTTALKRPVATPERRTLFQDDSGGADAPKPSPPVKQPKKKAKVPKSKSVPPLPSPEPIPAEAPKAAEEPKPEQAQPTPSVPKAKAKKKAVAKRKAKDGEQKEKGEQEEKGEGSKGGGFDRSHRLLNGKNAQTKALLHIEEAAEDPAEWLFLTKLYQSISVEYKDRHDTPKFSYWSLSMYWGDHRVGLLQRKEKGWKHVLSFGGTFCPSIGMPVQACRMFVRNLVDPCWPHKSAQGFGLTVIGMVCSVKANIYCIGCSNTNMQCPSI